MVETPCSWSAHRGLITGKSQWSRHAALQLSQWSRHLAVGQCSGGDEWQIPISDSRDTLQLVRVQRGRVASHSGRDTLQLVSAAGTSGKSQWSRHLAVGQCSGDEWQATVAKTPCKEEPASPSVPPSWRPSPQVYQRDQVPGSHTLTDYLRWDSHITNTTRKASKTRVLEEEPEGGLHDHQGAGIQSPG